MRTLSALILSFLAATSGSAAGQQFEVDSGRSRIEVAVKATLDSFTARLTAFDTDIRYDPATGRVEHAWVDFRFNDLKTGKAERDEQMQAWQESRAYPSGRFELQRIAPVDGTRERAYGVLTLHGVAQEVDFPVVVTGDNHRLSIDGEAVLDTRRFGLKIIRKFGLLKVSPEVVVRFHLQGRLNGALATSGGEP